MNEKIIDDDNNDNKNNIIINNSGKTNSQIIDKNSNIENGDNSNENSDDNISIESDSNYDELEQINPFQNARVSRKDELKNISKEILISELISDIRTQHAIFEIRNYINEQLTFNIKEISYSVYKNLRKIKSIGLFLYFFLVFFEEPWFCKNNTLFIKPRGNCSPPMAFANFYRLNTYVYRTIELLLLFTFLIVQRQLYQQRLLIKNINKPYIIIQNILFVLLILCVIDIIVGLITSRFPMLNFFLRGFNIILLLRHLRLAWSNIMLIFYGTKTLFLLLIINIAVFGCMGYYLFGNFLNTNKEFQSEYFRNYLESLYQLWILLSTCNFPDIMLSTLKCKFKKYNIFFFVFYILINYLLILGLLKALFFTKYFDIYSNEALKNIEEISMYRRKKIKKNKILQIISDFIGNESQIDQIENNNSNAISSNTQSYLNDKSQSDLSEKNSKLNNIRKDLSKKEKKIKDEKRKKIEEIKKLFRVPPDIPDDNNTNKKKKKLEKGIKTLINIKSKFNLDEGDNFEKILIVLDLYELKDSILNYEIKEVSVKKILQQNEIFKKIATKRFEIMIEIIDLILIFLPYYFKETYEKNYPNGFKIFFKIISILQCLWTILYFPEFMYLLNELKIKKFIKKDFLRFFFHIVNFIFLTCIICQEYFLFSDNQELFDLLLEFTKIIVGLRFFRLFVLLSYFSEFKVISKTIKNMQTLFIRNLLNLLSFFFLFSTLSMVLTGGNIETTSFKDNDQIPNNYFHINFNDFPSSFISCFALIMVNNLQIIAKSLSYKKDDEDSTKESKNTFFHMYFATFYFLSTLIILNNIQSLLLNMYLIVFEENRKKKKEKNKNNNENNNNDNNNNKENLNNI